MNSDEGLETLNWLESMLPTSQWRRILYIGWHPKTFGEWGGDWYLNHIRGLTRGAAPKHTIIEACKAYADALLAHPTRHKFNIRVIQDDVSRFVETSTDRFDVIFWWHGPEHVDEATLKRTLRKLESMCDGAVVLGCPEGEDPYEDHDADDRHRCILTTSLLHDLGYSTRLIDRSWKQQQPSISAVRLCGSSNRG